MFIFVTGGFRSGRSRYAIRRASELGPPPWLYVTAEPEPDEAVRGRVQRERKDKEAIWQTAVMPGDLAALVRNHASSGVGAVVLDSVSTWLAERLAANPGLADAALLAEVDRLAEAFYRSPAPLVVVSQEVSLGPLPEAPAAQRLARLLAAANQSLAAMAGHVVLMVSGVPLKVR